MCFYYEVWDSPLAESFNINWQKTLSKIKKKTWRMPQEVIRSMSFVSVLVKGFLLTPFKTWLFLFFPLVLFIWTICLYLKQSNSQPPLHLAPANTAAILLPWFIEAWITGRKQPEEECCQMFSFLKQGSCSLALIAHWILTLKCHRPPD